jgi:inner membrane transporter RhtA
VPYSLELAALRRLPPHVFGVLLSLEPAIAVLAGWVLLSQPIGPVGAVAVGVVVLASAGSTLSARQAEPTVDHPGELTEPPPAAADAPPASTDPPPAPSGQQPPSGATMPLGAAT